MSQRVFADSKMDESDFVVIDSSLVNYTECSCNRVRSSYAIF